MRVQPGGVFKLGPVYMTYLPMVMKFPQPPPPCVSSTGDSNNIADAITISSGQTVLGRVCDPQDLDDVYRISTVANQTLTISMNGTGGDADLYLYPPGATNVNTDPAVDYSENLGNNEFIQGAVLVGGFWYIDVYAYSGQTNYNLTVTLSGAGSSEVKTFNLTGTSQTHLRGQEKSSK
jgi:hypothetical protein